MTDPVFLLEREWPLQQRALADALAGWREREPALRRFETSARLLRFLHTNEPELTDGPLLALLRLARSDRRSGRLVLQAILPALKTQAARVATEAPREEVWELLLFFAWEAICCYPLERGRRVAANVVLQVLHDTTRTLRPERREPAAPERLPGEPAADLATGRAAGESLLADAVAAGAISEREAELILRTRVDGISLRLLARTQQVGYHALRQRRQRAERRLRARLASAGDVSIAAVPDLTSSAEAISPPARMRPLERRAA